jgi:hypothetical protein
MNQEEIKNRYVYKDGFLLRKNSSGGEKAGSIAGWLAESRDKKFYYRLTINKKTYYVHQIVYLYHHGYIPSYLDHIDGDGLNNKIENLRECTQSQNIANSKLSKANSSGYKGVTYRKDTKNWQAQITVNRKNISIGSYKTKKEAAIAYKNVSKKIYGDFARPEQASNRGIDRATQ